MRILLRLGALFFAGLLCFHGGVSLGFNLLMQRGELCADVYTPSGFVCAEVTWVEWLIGGTLAVAGVTLAGWQGHALSADVREARARGRRLSTDP